MAVAGVQGNMAAQARIMGHDAVAIVAGPISLTDVTSLITVNPTGITNGTYVGLTTTVSPLGGSGAVFTAKVAGGTVTELTTTTSGTGYSTGDSVVISAAQLTGASGE